MGNICRRWLYTTRGSSIADQAGVYTRHVVVCPWLKFCDNGECVRHRERSGKVSGRRHLPLCGGWGTRASRHMPELPATMTVDCAWGLCRPQRKSISPLASAGCSAKQGAAVSPQQWKTSSATWQSCIPQLMKRMAARLLTIRCSHCTSMLRLLLPAPDR